MIFNHDFPLNVDTPRGRVSAHHGMDLTISSP